MSICEFAHLCKQFFLFSMRKIICLNSQQPKTRGHVEHLSQGYFFITVIVHHVTKPIWNRVKHQYDLLCNVKLRLFEIQASYVAWALRIEPGVA